MLLGAALSLYALYVEYRMGEGEYEPLCDAGSFSCSAVCREVVLIM